MKNILTEKFLNDMWNNVHKQYVEGSAGNSRGDHNLFLVKIYCEGFINTLTYAGYSVTIEKDGKQEVFKQDNKSIEPIVGDDL